MADTITFALAYIAYCLVALGVALHAWRRPARAATVAAAAVALAHVGLVWSLRFAWSVGYALEKSPAGFLIFHTALAMIVAAAVAPAAMSRRLLGLAFPVVTAGSLGAAFRYDFVAAYRLPLLVVFAAAALAGVAGLWRFRACPAPANRPR